MCFPMPPSKEEKTPYSKAGSLSKNLQSNMLLHNQAKHVNIDSCKGALKDPKQDPCSAHAGLKPENTSFFQNSLSLEMFWPNSVPRTRSHNGSLLWLLKQNVMDNLSTENSDLCFPMPPSKEEKTPYLSNVF